MDKWDIYDRGDWYELQYICGHYIISSQYDYASKDIKTAMFELKEGLKCEYCNK